MKALVIAVALVGALAFPAASAAMGMYSIGNGDWVAIWTTAETQQLESDNFPSTKAWEKGICQLIRKLPKALAVRRTCSAKYALKAIEKKQLDWFFYHARLESACAVAIFDFGRHPIREGWKVRSATDWDHKIGLAYVSFGTSDNVRRSDTGGPIEVTCNA